MDDMGCAGDGRGDAAEFAVGDDPTPEMFRAIAETAVNPFAIIDDDGVIRWIGRSIEELLGWKPHELIGRTMDVIVAPWSLVEVGQAFLELAELPAQPDYPRGGVGQSADLLCRDGSITHCNLIAATRSQTGLPYHVVFARRAGYERALDCALEAIAEHVGLDEVLAHLVDTLQQSVPGCAVAIGDGWHDLRFSTAVGDGADLLVPHPQSPWARALATGEDVAVRRIEEMSPEVAAPLAARGLTSCWVHPVQVPGDDAARTALVMWRPADGMPTRFTWSAVRRTGRLLRFTLQWDRSRRALEYAAHHDTLTGLGNRSAFVERLAEIAKKAEGDAAVLFVDLDRFKPVNDQLGHLAGDHVLRAVGDRMAGAVRPGDLVARIGGDEFAVLCERVNGLHLGGVARRLLDALAAPIILDDTHEVSITASIGATRLRASDDAEDVLARADLAMREAKATGPGRWLDHGAVPT